MVSIGRRQTGGTSDTLFVLLHVEAAKQHDCLFAEYASIHWICGINTRAVLSQSHIYTFAGVGE